MSPWLKSCTSVFHLVVHRTLAFIYRLTSSTVHPHLIEHISHNHSPITLLRDLIAYQNATSCLCPSLEMNY
ncbi:hypothetical protein BD626DRAFT_476136 [Schizophyllum amplum]|uniref:Uncharacterized protein n=1 Tax=Schizophyllum amplum TaxID=97359 RepID=A0A550CZ41_9AGAR|nr:hypothetical protein BD626DRAFT_476136 [Auriculariopsis ampla]